jgi:hypothetical protein
VASKAWGT